MCLGSFLSHSNFYKVVYEGFDFFLFATDFILLSYLILDTLFLFFFYFLVFCINFIVTDSQKVLITLCGLVFNKSFVIHPIYGFRCLWV